MKRLTIKDAKELAKKLDLPQVILVAWDGKKKHVVTYGKSVADEAQAALGGNAVRRALGFPEELCHEVPARVKKAAKEVSDENPR